MLPVQSAPQEHKILAEVMLVSPKRSGVQEEQNSASEKNLEKIEESVTKIQIREEENKINETRATVPEAAKAIEPQKNVAKKQVKPIEKAAPKKPAEKKINAAHDIHADTNKIDINKESDISASYSENTSPKSSAAGNPLSQARAHSLIAAVDSVVVVNRVKPVYPQISRKRGEEGNVVLLASVKNGKVVDVTIEKSSGIKALDSSALAAVGKWSFSADTSIVVRIPVSFRLKD
jgi:protein TonB